MKSLEKHLQVLELFDSHNAQDIQDDKFEGVNERLTKTHVFVNTAMSFLNPGMTLVFGGLNLALIVVGAVLISQNALGSTPIEGPSYPSRIYFLCYDDHDEFHDAYYDVYIFT